MEKQKEAVATQTTCPQLESYLIGARDWSALQSLQEVGTAEKFVKLQELFMFAFGKGDVQAAERYLKAVGYLFADGISDPDLRAHERAMHARALVNMLENRSLEHEKSFEILARWIAEGWRAEHRFDYDDSAGYLRFLVRSVLPTKIIKEALFDAAKEETRIEKLHEGLKTMRGLPSGFEEFSRIFCNAITRAEPQLAAFALDELSFLAGQPESLHSLASAQLKKIRALQGLAKEFVRAVEAMGCGCAASRCAASIPKIEVIYTAEDRFEVQFRAVIDVSGKSRLDIGYIYESLYGSWVKEAQKLLAANEGLKDITLRLSVEDEVLPGHGVVLKRAVTYFAGGSSPAE